MHIKSLKVFCDVVSRRSFSKAADDNGMSQSGASQTVHHLEDRLGVKLIDRSKRPFTLTKEGSVYYEGCRKLVQRFNALEEEVRNLHQTVAGRVAVASIYSVGLSHLSGHVKEFMARNPKADLRLEYQHPDKVWQMVEFDEVDLGIVSYPKSTRTTKAVPWLDEPMVVVCSPNHPFAGRESVSIGELQDIDFVGFDSELKIRQELNKSFAGHEVSPRIEMEFDNIETIKRAVEIDSGISILPLPSVEREVALGTLAAIPLDDIQLTRPVGMVCRRGKELGRTTERFIKLLLEKSCLEDPRAREMVGSKDPPPLESETAETKESAVVDSPGDKRSEGESNRVDRSTDKRPLHTING